MATSTVTASDTVSITVELPKAAVKAKQVNDEFCSNPAIDVVLARAHQPAHFPPMCRRSLREDGLAIATE